MIADSLANIEAYKGMNPNIDAGIAFLTSNDLSSLPEGRNEIDGDKVYALVQHNTTTPAAEKPFESHRNYIDIQVVAEGAEIIFWTLTDGLKEKSPYDAEKDAALYYNADALPVALQRGMFAIFLPHDAHKPGCILESSSKVTKIVVKCAV